MLINRGLLYLQLKDYGNALLDFVDTGKVLFPWEKYFSLQIHIASPLLGIAY